MATSITELDFKCQQLHTEIINTILRCNDEIRDLEATVSNLTEELDGLKRGVVTNPDNYTYMGYSLQDLFALAYKCQECGLTEYDLKQVAKDFELALEIVHKQERRVIHEQFLKLVGRSE